MGGGAPGSEGSCGELELSNSRTCIRARGQPSAFRQSWGEWREGVPEETTAVGMIIMLLSPYSISLFISGFGGSLG